MELHAERNLARREPVHDSTGLRVPQLQVPVVAGRHELRALVVERHILDRLPVAGVRPDAAALAVHLPQLHAAVHRGGQQQVRGLRHEADGRDALRVAGPRVDVRLGQEALVGRRIGAQVDADVVRRVQERAALVVGGIADCVAETGC